MESTTKDYLPGGVTQDQLDGWKKAYSEVHAITATKGSLTGTCYLKKADLKVIKRMLGMFRQDLVGAGEIAINNLWLGGDAYIKDPKNTDEEALRAAVALEAFSVLDLPTTTSEILKN